MAFAALALAVTGVWGLIRMRSWGVLSLGAAGALVAAGGHLGQVRACTLPCGGSRASCRIRVIAGMTPRCEPLLRTFSPTLAFVLLAAAVIPFAGAIVRYLRRPA